jgi:hypothetical protein
MSTSVSELGRSNWAEASWGVEMQERKRERESKKLRKQLTLDSKPRRFAG